jgi:hypothetical protein
MKNWVKTAQQALSNVAEVVAPTPKTALESFRQHWNAIRNFYIDQKHDVESGNIPTHLHALVQLLVEENDERPAAGDTGVCMEFFIQNRLMETLCALCLIDKPSGVRKLILAAINSIVGNLRNIGMLIPHMSIHQPLANLIGGMTTMQLAGELVDALTLIKTCLGIVAADPTLGEFLVVVPPEGKSSAEYAVWSALTSLFKRTTPEQRERIEDLLLRAINSASPAVMELIMRSEFHVRLVEDILGLFSSLPKVMPQTRSMESEHVYRFKLHLRFCNSLTSPQAGLTNIPNAFSDALLLALEESFLERALVPALHDATGSILTRDTWIAKETLQLLSGPLQDAFISLSVGLQAAPLRDSLCQRMLSSDAGLAIATMRLFDVVCGLYHAHGYESLMVSHIKTREDDEETTAIVAVAATVEGSSPAPQRVEEAGGVTDTEACTFQPILHSFPAVFTHDRMSGSALDSYTLHARTVMSQVAAMHAALGIPQDNERRWVRFDHCKGPFLDAVFTKLRRFSMLSLKEVLLVTSLVSRVLKYPSRALYECVAHAALEVVALAAAESELYVSRLRLPNEDIKTAIDKAAVTLAALRDFELKANQDEVSVFFQKLVCLDEFVRELVAIDVVVRVEHQP